MTSLALVCGAGGFIGSHLVKRLKAENYFVVGVDQKEPEYTKSRADKYFLGDLRDRAFLKSILEKYDFNEIYQLAADMGGAGFVFTGANDAQIMQNSTLINLNVLSLCSELQKARLFFSSSACVYPEHNQLDPNNVTTEECTAYPAAPDSEYGWEKLYSERMYLSYARNYKMDVRIARYHNIFGPEGTWRGGREKAPAAICRKVLTASDPGQVEIWGDGQQTRSFLFIDECIEGTLRLMRSNYELPLNIGSDKQISINDLTRLVVEISKKYLKIKNVEGPVGVRGRNSHNKLIQKVLDWTPNCDLGPGLSELYFWVKKQINENSLTKLNYNNP